ncbi:hypothetical protein RRG08_036105 [Elysia crispata]|uniref:Uncharacterized protein n=1 Tax=Elysia crispata TaxID=231223 RepID=A0AAE1E0S2_9GAST|nr:hypothetical protein RRG08_036105 [Elysia crispata]
MYRTTETNAPDESGRLLKKTGRREEGKQSSQIVDCPKLLNHHPRRALNSQPIDFCKCRAGWLTVLQCSYLRIDSRPQPGEMPKTELFSVDSTWFTIFLYCNKTS